MNRYRIGLSVVDGNGSRIIRLEVLASDGKQAQKIAEDRATQEKRESKNDITIGLLYIDRF